MVRYFICIMIYTLLRTVKCSFSQASFLSYTIDWERYQWSKYNNIVYNLISSQNNNQGNAFGFSITSLQQLTALVANVSSKGTNFIHFLVTVHKYIIIYKLLHN